VQKHYTDRDWLLPLDAIALTGLGLFFATRRRASS
jgi:general stress protein CsbA